MKKRSLKSYIFTLGAIMILMVIAISIVSVYYASKLSVTKSLQAIGEETVGKILSEFDSERYEEFLKQPIENEEYEFFVNQLNEALHQYGVSYVYTLTYENNELKIIIDGSKPPVKIGALTTGTTYKDAKDAFSGLFTSSELIKDSEFGNYISSFGPIKNQSGEVIGVLGVDSNPDLIKEISNSISSKILLICFLVILIFILVTTLISKFLLEKKLNLLNNITQTIKHISDGNLTEAKKLIHANKIVDQTEIGELYNSSKNMIGILEQFISGIQLANKNVYAQSELLNHVISEINNQTEHITNAMNEIASTTESEANLASNLNDVMHEFTNLYEVATTSGDNIVASSQKILEEAHVNLGLMTHSKENTEEVYQIITNAVNEVHNLNKENMKVSSLVSLITDISEQTNLLSLNASIEAARAGENGRGFAVVAKEVSNLSQEVSNSVNDINTIVNTVMNNSLKMVEILQNGLEKVGQARDNIINTSSNFDQMVHTLSEMGNLAKHMHTQLQLVSKKEETMSASIAEIASISEQNSACTQEVYSSNHEVHASIQSLIQSTTHLNQTALELTNMINQFKIDKNI